MKCAVLFALAASLVSSLAYAAPDDQLAKEVHNIDEYDSLRQLPALLDGEPGFMAG